MGRRHHDPLQEKFADPLRGSPVGLRIPDCYPFQDLARVARLRAKLLPHLPLL